MTVTERIHVIYKARILNRESGNPETIEGFGYYADDVYAWLDEGRPADTVPITLEDGSMTYFMPYSAFELV